MMEDNELISVALICSSYEIEPGFIDSLLDYGLIEVNEVGSERFIESSRVVDLERMIHLHYDLEINLEGIDTILHLLGKMYSLQEELAEMRNRLRFFGME